MNGKWIRRAFCAAMLITCCVLAWWGLEQYSLRFQLEDTALSLETNQGREAKQQAEYDQVCIDLPAARAQLEELQPQADAAAREVAGLKEQRKVLREEVAALQEQLDAKGLTWEADTEGGGTP